jgi:hypothetical protein
MSQTTLVKNKAIVLAAFDTLFGDSFPVFQGACA